MSTKSIASERIGFVVAGLGHRVLSGELGERSQPKGPGSPLANRYSLVALRPSRNLH